MESSKFKEISKWLCQIFAVISLLPLVYVKSKFTFDNGNFAANLLLISIIAALFTFAFAIAALPRWQALVSLAIFAFVAYSNLFTGLYTVPFH